MRLIPAVSNELRTAGTLRATAAASLVLALSVQIVGAPLELRIDIPGATHLTVTDISANRRFAIGQSCGQSGCTNFLWQTGELTTVEMPGAQDVHLQGVNNAGDVVGFAWSPDTGERAFLRRLQGTITPIACPFAMTVRPSAINNGRTVVGSWFGPGEMTGAFRWRNGRCEQLPINDGFIFPADIAENGIVVGIAGLTGELTPFYAFMIRGDELTVVVHPDAPFDNGGLTQLAAVAPNGLALGATSPDLESLLGKNDLRWFVYRDGQFEAIDVPGPPRDFRPLSISSSGVITYQDSDNVIRTLRVGSTLAQ